MEFKDKLKKLRKEKGISQETLAKAIFISRSAVAKWENGLGNPGRTSLLALAKYFGVEEEYFKTESAEAVIVEKNRKIKRLASALGMCILMLSVILSFAVSYLVILGSWGFTSEMASGYAEPETVEKLSFDDCDIYYRLWFDEPYKDIGSFRVVKKTPIGFFVTEDPLHTFYIGDRLILVVG